MSKLLKPLLLGGTLVAAGAAAHRASAPASTASVGKSQRPRVPSKGAGAEPYQALIGAVVKEGGVKDDRVKILLGEEHSDTHIVRVTELTVKAALKTQAETGQDDKTVAVYRELPIGMDTGEARDFESSCAGARDSLTRNECASLFVQTFPHNGAPASDREHLVQVVADNGVVLNFLKFDDATQFDLERFVTDKRVAIASLGSAHVTGKLETKGGIVNVIDPCGVYTPLVSPLNKLPPAAQKASFDGFAQARAKGTAVYVIPGSTLDMYEAEYRRQGYPSFDMRSYCHAYLSSQGNLVAKVDIDDFNAIVIAPREMKPTFEKVMRKYPDTISLVGEGGSGWGKPTRRPLKEDL